MLRVCPAGQVCASSWFGQACSAQRDAAGEIPIRTLFLCCNLRGKKNPQMPTALSAPADEALFSSPPIPPAFSNIYLNISPLYPPGMQWVCWSLEVYSANLAGHVPGKSIQVCLARPVRGSLPAPRAGGQRRCGASLAWPRVGNFPVLARRLCLAS